MPASRPDADRQRAAALAESRSAALQDALRVQAGVVGNLDTTARRSRRWSRRASRPSARCRRRKPATSSSPCRHSSSPTSPPLLAAQGRAQSPRGGPQAAAEEQAREQLRRFLTPGSGYQPDNVTMFH